MISSPKVLSFSKTGWCFYITLLFFGLTFSGVFSACKYFGSKSKKEEKPLARVGEEYLYASSLFSMTRGLSPSDSARLVKDYVQSWVKRKLLVEKAQNYIDADKAELFNKVEDYKNSLILYEYEKALIGEKLDTSVGEAEFKKYYDANRQAFTLTSDLIHVYYVKLNADAEDLDKFRKWIKKNLSEEEFLKFEGYCEAYAGAFDISKGSWLTYEEMTARFPLDMQKVVALQKASGYQEIKNQNELWFIKIDQVLHPGETAPMEFVSKNILDLILNKRKVQLIENTYEKIWKDGMENNEAEIFLKN